MASLLATPIAACAPAVLGTSAPAASERSAERGTLHVDSLWAPALGVRKRVIVYLPPSYGTEPGRHYPTAYYLHGMWGSERDWSSQGRIGTVADSLIAGGMPELIIIMPDGDNGYYTTWATAGDVEGCRRRPPVPEPPESYCVESPRYDEYMARDLVRWTDSTFRTRADAAHRAVAGLSMGGYGAIMLALGHPEVWSAAASHSGVLSLLQIRDPGGVVRAAGSGEELARRWGPRFWPLIEPVFGRDTAAWWAREPARVAQRRVAARAPLPALFVDVGVADALVAEGNRIFRDEMRRLGVSVEYREWPGAHDWNYWRAHVPESLQWLAGRIAAGDG